MEIHVYNYLEFSFHVQTALTNHTVTGGVQLYTCISIQSPFERMAKGMTDLSGDGSVLKKVLRNGIGPVVPEGAVVRGKQHQSPFIAFSIPLQSITMDTSSILTNHMIQ